MPKWCYSNIAIISARCKLLACKEWRCLRQAIGFVEGVGDHIVEETAWEEARGCLSITFRSPTVASKASVKTIIARIQENLSTAIATTYCEQFPKYLRGWFTLDQHLNFWAFIQDVSIFTQTTKLAAMKVINWASRHLQKRSWEDLFKWDPSRGSAMLIPTWELGAGQTLFLCVLQAVQPWQGSLCPSDSIAAFGCYLETLATFRKTLHQNLNHLPVKLLAL